MDTKHLITFIQTAELGSFTKAAKILGYSQSTVSFQIKQLETELNTQLFERINHTITLTEKGKEVLEYAHQIHKLTKELGETMQEISKEKGYVRMAMADSLCDSLLERDFADFRKAHPEIALKIISAGTEEMFRLLNHNEADLILTLDHHIYNTEYRIAREEKVKVNFVAKNDSPLQGLKQISISELIQQPFLLTEKGMSYRRLMDEKLAELCLEIHPVLEIGSTRQICSLIEQGIGISFLPEYVTDEKVKQGKLCYLQVENFEIQVWKQLLYHRSKWISPAMEAVLNYCIKREFNLLKEVPHFNIE